MNPWNISQREQEVLAAVAIHGSMKGAARALGISHKTAEAHMRNVRRRMGIERILPAVLEFARWKWKQEIAA